MTSPQNCLWREWQLKWKITFPLLGLRATYFRVREVFPQLRSPVALVTMGNTALPSNLIPHLHPAPSVLVPGRLHENVRGPVGGEERARLAR